MNARQALFFTELYPSPQVTLLILFLELSVNDSFYNLREIFEFLSLLCFLQFYLLVSASPLSCGVLPHFGSSDV
jgi:hypothetical protein